MAWTIANGQVVNELGAVVAIQQSVRAYVVSMQRCCDGATDPAPGELLRLRGKEIALTKGVQGRDRTIAELQALIESQRAQLAATRTQLASMERAVAGRDADIATWRDRANARGAEIETLTARLWSADRDRDELRAQAAATDTHVDNLERLIATMTGDLAGHTEWLDWELAPKDGSKIEVLMIAEDRGDYVFWNDALSAFVGPDGQPMPDLPVAGFRPYVEPPATPAVKLETDDDGEIVF